MTASVTRQIAVRCTNSELAPIRSNADVTTDGELKSKQRLAELARIKSAAGERLKPCCDAVLA